MASPNRQPGVALDPQALMQMHFSHAPARILAAGVQLNVFSHIANGNHTAAEVASAAGATERGIRMLLDASTGLELLRKQDGRYELTPMAAAFLVKESPDYLGWAAEAELIENPWMHLTEVIRTGRPRLMVDGRADAEKFFPNLVRSLHVVNREPARRLAAALTSVANWRVREVLDVAAGSGIWGISIAEAEPQARVTAQDFPGMIPLAREYAARHGVADRFTYLEGDLKDVDFGENRFDAAVLGNIVHSEGEAASRDLFRRMRRAIKPGGRLAIIEMIPNDERNGPPFPLIFALNMLVHTDVGDTYTLAEYRQWLKEAGFGSFEALDVASHSPAIIAR
jgi:ubiquinone/menaquinone biosynthesis C-methylase UbiE